MERTMAHVFRRAYRYAVRNRDETGVNAVGAFPVLNFTPDYTLDVILVKDTAGTTVTYPNLPHSDDAIVHLHNRLAGADINHENVTYAAGFPNYEFNRTENGMQAGVTLLKPEAIEIRILPRGGYRTNNWVETMVTNIEIDKYATENQFVGGFCDCFIPGHQIRCFLFKEEYFVRQKKVPEWRLRVED